jgi:tetratricopeptide (TPR) repeat protein
VALAYNILNICTVDDQSSGCPMSETTLQKYYAKLEDFLQQQRNDEVVQHSRYILRAFPRNVRAFRLMGSALLAGGQYDDAERALRRVLRVYPADEDAHLGLSRIAEHRRDGPAVIWHLERAYEQHPTDSRIQEAMRDAYRQYRKTELTRLPLTARLIASQQIRSGLYPKAISTLRAAVNQLPTRIDLHVLLAQALWEAGYEIEAGEAALQILNSLPESLEANEIMTRLWLREGRPSDAQRYLSRIEAVDPLYAYEVAQGTPAPDNIFRLNEFNYQLEANRQLVSDSPDWLDSFGEVPDAATEDSPDDFSLSDDSASAATSDEDWLSAAFSLDDFDENTTETEVNSFALDVLSDNDSVPELSSGSGTASESDDDWLSAFENEVDAPETSSQSTAPQARDAEAADAADAPANDRAWIDLLNEVQTTASSPTRQVSTDEFDQLFAEKQDFDQLLAEVDNGWTPDEDVWAAQDDDHLTQSEAEKPNPVSADDKSSTPVITPSGRTGLTGLLSSLEEPPSGSTGLTGLLDAMDDSTELSTDELAPGSQADDWMRDVNKPTARLEPTDLPSDVDVFADDFEPVDDSLSWLGTAADDVELPEASDYDPDDSLAWMRESGIEFMENAPASALDAAFAADADEKQGPVSDPNINNPLAWARGLGVEFLETDVDEERLSRQPADTTRADEQAVFGISANTEHSNADAGAVSNLEDVSDLGNQDDLSDQEVEEADSLVRMSDEAVEWLDDETASSTTPTAQAQSDFTFTEQDGQGAMNDENNDRTPDWLSSNDQSDDFGADDFEEDLFGATESETGDDSLDWLNMLEDDAVQSTQGDAVPENPTGTTSSGSSAFDDEFSELDRALGLDSVPDAPRTEEELPDWLLASRPDQSAAETPSNAPAFDESLFDEPSISSVDNDLEMAWGADNTDATDEDSGSEFGVEEFETPEAGEEAVPDWLSALNPSPASQSSADFETMLGDFDSTSEDLETEKSLFAVEDLSFDEMDEDSEVPEQDPVIRAQVDAATGEFASVEDLSEWSPRDEHGGLLPFDTVDDAVPATFDIDFDFDSEADLWNRASVTTDDSSFGVPSEEDREAAEEFDFAFSDSADENDEISEQVAATGENLPDWLLEIGDRGDAGSIRNADSEPQSPSAPSDALDTEGEIPAWLQSAAPAEATTSGVSDFNLNFDAADEDSADDELWELEDEEAAAPAMENAGRLNDFSLGTEDEDSDLEEAEEFDFSMASSEQSEFTTSEAVGDFGDFGEFETEDETTEAFGTSSIPSWLSALDEPEEEESDEISAPAPITSLDVASDRGVSDYGFDDGDDLVLDVDEMETQIPDSIVSDGETLDRELDWMLEDEEEEPEFVAQFGDLPRLDEADSGEEELYSLDTGDFEFNGDEERLQGLELVDEIEPVPASNAPDWLNAMVPGLDLDYEAEPSDDEFSDEIFAAEEDMAAAESPTGSYAWVTEIVEEELRPPMTLPEPVRATSEAAAVPPSTTERASRFSFDRAPVWLRRLRGEKSNALGSTSNGDVKDDDFASPSASTGDAAVNAAVGSGMLLNDVGVTGSDMAEFDEDLFDDEVFNTDDAVRDGIRDDDDDDLDFDLNDVGVDEFDTLGDFDDDEFDMLSDSSATSFDADFGADFNANFDSGLDADEDLDLDDNDETDLPPWLRLDGDD